MNYRELKQIFQELKGTSPRDDLNWNGISIERMETGNENW